MNQSDAEKKAFHEGALDAYKNIGRCLELNTTLRVIKERVMNGIKTHEISLLNLKYSEDENAQDGQEVQER